MAKKKRNMFVIAKGNPDVEGNMLKMNAINVIVKFIQLAVPKTVVMSDRNTMIVIFPDNDLGDVKWLQDNVFRYVDIIGTTNDNEAQKKAEKAYDKYSSAAKDGKNKVGSGILLHYLQQASSRWKYDRQVQKNRQSDT